MFLLLHVKPSIHPLRRLQSSGPQHRAVTINKSFAQRKLTHGIQFLFWLLSGFLLVCWSVSMSSTPAPATAEGTLAFSIERILGSELTTPENCLKLHRPWTGEEQQLSMWILFLQVKSEGPVWFFIGKQFSVCHKLCVHLTVVKKKQKTKLYP